MKPQFKDIAHHYEKLKVTDSYGQILDVFGYHKESGFILNILGDRTVNIDEVKPHFLPMSSLTLDSGDGESHLVKLARISFPKMDWKSALGNAICYYENLDHYFEWCDNGFSKWNCSEETPVPNQLQLFQYLFDNHFNCFGLDESEYIKIQ